MIKYISINKYLTVNCNVIFCMNDYILLVHLFSNLHHLPHHAATVMLHPEPGQVLPCHHAHHLVVIIQHQHVSQTQSSEQVKHLFIVKLTLLCLSRRTPSPSAPLVSPPCSATVRDHDRPQTSPIILVRSKRRYNDCTTQYGVIVNS